MHPFPQLGVLYKRVHAGEHTDQKPVHAFPKPLPCAAKLTPESEGNSYWNEIPFKPLSERPQDLESCQEVSHFSPFVNWETLEVTKMLGHLWSQVRNHLANSMT